MSLAIVSERAGQGLPPELPQGTALYKLAALRLLMPAAATLPAGFEPLDEAAARIKKALYLLVAIVAAGILWGLMSAHKRY